MEIKKIFLFINLAMGSYPIYGNRTFLELDNPSLDTLAIHHGTDKGSEWHYEGIKEVIRYPHAYANKYDFYFSSQEMNQSNFLKLAFGMENLPACGKITFPMLNYIIWISVQNFLKNMGKIF